MGLFSTVINQCPVLGPDFIGELQTKDLENVLDYYWLSPDGCLFLIDFSKSFQLQDDPQAKVWYERFTMEPTGEKGRLRPYRRSFVARMYPAKASTEWKEVSAFFKMGKLNCVLPVEAAWPSEY